MANKYEHNFFLKVVYNFTSNDKEKIKKVCKAERFSLTVKVLPEHVKKLKNHIINSKLVKVIKCHKTPVNAA
jgi:hypothetical protein